MCRGERLIALPSEADFCPEERVDIADVRLQCLRRKLRIGGIVEPNLELLDDRLTTHRNPILLGGNLSRRDVVL